MNECLYHHPACPTIQPGGEPELPTRVLFVGKAPETQILLFEPGAFGGEGGRRAPYIALSYCWGKKAQTVTLTSESMEKLKGGIQIAHLPRTIREAVLITRNLGLQFLWVDALCIIQDSEEDWKTESAKMGSVYKNAYITLAAGSATAVDEGFVVNNEPERYVSICSLPFQSSAHGAYGKAFLYTKDRETTRPDAPLQTRGWCFQEQLLSPRYLLLRTTDMEFRCQNRKLTNRHDQTRLAHKYFGTADPNEAAYSESYHLEHDLHHNWRALMSQYSRRQLTYGSDKLVAVASLASEFQKLTDDHYNAGCWASSMANDLLWETGGFPKRPAEYRAPSWSWASFEGGEANWPEDHDASTSQVAFETMTTRITLAAMNKPFGHVLAGHVFVRTRLRSCAMDAALDGRLSCAQVVPMPAQLEALGGPKVSFDFYKPPYSGYKDRPQGELWTVRITNFHGLVVVADESYHNSWAQDEHVERGGQEAVRRFRRIGRYEMPRPLASIFGGVAAGSLLGGVGSMEDEHVNSMREFADWWYGDGAFTEEIMIV